VAACPGQNLLVARQADQWTAAQKADLVLQILRGETQRADACRVHGLERSQLDCWVEAFLAAGTGALGDAGAAGPATHELRTILDRIPTLVWRSDDDGSAELFNWRWLEYTGMSADEASGGGWTAALHPDDVARVLEQWREIMASRRPGHLEARLRRADGTYRWFQVRALPQRDAEAGIVRWYALLSDIEDRKRVERTLAESELELARVTRLVTMGELTASIAHEVNQPLGAVVNNANACLVLSSQTDPPLDEIREALAEIVEDADRASAVIARVRQLATKAPLERTRLDLRTVVADALALARHESERRRVTLRSELPADLPCVVGDRVQLQQVLLNLVVNGIEASSTVEESRRVLTIGGHRAVRDDKPEVVVSVQDAGVGVTPERAAKLFQAFYSTKPEGMGMGLSISHSIMVAHGGRLWVESNDGPGATFLFSVPEAAPVHPS
jgi:PAS domain S-box-containing protein